MNPQKLWILKARNDLTPDIDPWEPWYDKAFGFLISATTEQEARELANSNAGGENFESPTVWLDPKYTTCRLAEPTQETSILLKDFRAA